MPIIWVIAFVIGAVASYTFMDNLAGEREVAPPSPYHVQEQSRPTEPLQPVKSSVPVQMASTPAVQRTGYEFAWQWGSPGSGKGQFSVDSGPRGIAVVGEVVYQADYINDRIQKFHTSGYYIGQKQVCCNLQDIEYDGHGAFYVRLVGAVVKLDLNLREIWRIEAPAAAWVSYGLCIDSDRNIHVPVAPTTDPADSRMLKISSEGRLMKEYGLGIVDGGGQCAVTSGYVYARGRQPTQLKQFTDDGALVGTTDFGFNITNGFAFDKEGNLFIGLDYGDSPSGRPYNPYIRAYDRSFKLLAEWGGSGSGNGKFFTISDLEVDANGYIYVTDGGNDGNYLIQVFKPRGAQ